MNRTNADLKRDYKLNPPAAGVYAVRNRVSGALLVDAASDVEAALNRLRFELRMGGHRHPGLHADWRAQGAGDFAFEVLARVEPSSDPAFDARAELARLLARQAAAHGVAPGIYGLPGA